MKHKKCILLNVLLLYYIFCFDDLYPMWVCYGESFTLSSLKGSAKLIQYLTYRGMSDIACKNSGDKYIGTRQHPTT